MKILNILTAHNQSHFELNDDLNTLTKFDKSVDVFTKEYLTTLVSYGQKPTICYIGVWESLDKDGNPFLGKPQEFDKWNMISDITDQYSDYGNYKKV